jgi:hypothetical protein
MAKLAARADGDVQNVVGGAAESDMGHDEKFGEKLAVFFEHAREFAGGCGERDVGVE